VTNYPVLLLFNIVLFTLFQEATGSAVTSVVSQEGIVRKTQFQRLVIPLSVVLTSLFNLGLNLVAVFIFILAFGVSPTWTWLFLPLVIVLLSLITTAVSMLLSSLYVRFRDVSIIWSVVLTMLFYGTPLLYPVEIVPEKYRDLVSINPLTPLFEQARKWIIDPEAPGAAAAAGGWVHLIPAIVIFVALCGLAVLTFARAAPRIAEEL
jgi:ABC-2 type transport system permease protein